MEVGTGSERVTPRVRERERLLERERGWSGRLEGLESGGTLSMQRQSEEHKIEGRRAPSLPMQ